ncbi:MAG: flavodoxin family protein [Chloroflexota bacterium]
MVVRILGICATPLKGETNTEILLQATLDAARSEGKDVATEVIRLADLNIKSGCTHCNWCLTRQTADKICAINDDMDKVVYRKIIEADALVFATPVYIGRMSWLLTAMIDRLRALLEGRYYGGWGPYGGAIADKVVTGCSVAWFRHGGVETALLNIMITAAMCGWVMVTAGMGFGVGGVSAAPPGKTGACRDDRYAMSSARSVGTALARMTRIIKAGKEVLRDAPAYVGLR